MNKQTKKNAGDKTDQLWKAYQQAPNEKTLAKLVEAYIPLVRQIVARMAIYARPEMDRDDFLQYAMMGLWNAIERFDFQRGVKFNSYAATRIRGAVLDALRQCDHLTRTDRTLLKTLQSCILSYAEKHHEAPSEKQLAQAADISLKRLHELTTRAQATLSLDSIHQQNDDGDGMSLSDHLVDENSPDPSASAAQQEMGAAFRKVFRKLPARQQKILYLYYYEDLTLKQIGEILELTEARICQLHASTLFVLRGLLKTAS